MDQSLLYRSLLRVSAVVTAVVLLFQSGLVDERTTVLFTTTTDQLSAMVGASASVAPTETNTFTAELTKQQQLLLQREEVIAEREIALGLSVDEEPVSQMATYILATILFVQLLLIVLNYGLDYLRVREGQALRLKVKH
jgi:hypothetical protein